MASTESMLNVTDINVKIKETNILRNIKFTAKSGNILAILGPTGAGKTTLLKVIAGRQSYSSGQVTLNAIPFNKQLRRRLGFVLQQDVFFSNLTLWETLYFTAMIRVPEMVPYAYKLARLNEVIDILSLRGCINTKIGDVFTGGLSGGEKKRASIACELLTDPDILLLDEPTSGLDASLAFSLMQQLQTLAKAMNKMLILTIHQPSKRIYNMFDSLLLMSKGSVDYFGEAHEAPIETFKSFGFACERDSNPADFYLEILKSNDTELDKIIVLDANTKKMMNPEKSSGITANEPIVTVSSRIETADADNQSTVYSIVAVKSDSVTEKWPTSFTTQLKLLTRRNYVQSKGTMVTLLSFITNVVLCTCAALAFFQVSERQDSIRDRLGLIYIYSIIWDIEPIAQVVNAMQGERGIITKERSSGAYRMSAYYIAKSVSELPLRIIMPALFYTIVYWAAGLGGVTEFFMTLPLALLNALNSQGLGMLLGSFFMDGRAANLCGQTIILMGVLFSGYLNVSFPPWFRWCKYLSIIHYPLGAIGTVLFRDLNDIPCNETSITAFPHCAENATGFVTASDILKSATIDIPLHCYVSTLVLIFIVIRFATYVALRCRLRAPA